MDMKLRFGVTCKKESTDTMITFFTVKGGLLKDHKDYNVFGTDKTFMEFEFDKSNMFRLSDCTTSVRCGTLEVNGVSKKWFDKKKTMFIKDIVIKLLGVNSRGSYGWDTSKMGSM